MYYLANVWAISVPKPVSVLTYICISIYTTEIAHNHHVDIVSKLAQIPVKLCCANRHIFVILHLYYLPTDMGMLECNNSKEWKLSTKLQWKRNELNITLRSIKNVEDTEPGNNFSTVWHKFSTYLKKFIVQSSYQPA